MRQKTEKATLKVAFIMFKRHLNNIQRNNIYRLGNSVQHYICVVGIVVHVGIELYFICVLEWISKVFVVSKPIAKLNYRRLVRSEIYEPLALQDREDIQIVTEPPTHIVSPDFCAQIWRVNQEHHIRIVFVPIEKFFVVAAFYHESVQISIAGIIGFSYIIVHTFFA